MISSSLSPRRRRSDGKWFVLAALVVLAGGVYVLRGPLSGLLWSALQPIAAWRYGAGAAAELASTTAALAGRDALYKENVELKKLLGRSAEAPSVLASVLMRPPQTPYDTLVIDLGEQDGIALNAGVSAGGTSLVGRVTDLYAHTARVTLFSASGETYDAVLLTKSGSMPVSVEGQGGGSLRGQVPSGSDVKVGDPVVLPGIAGSLAATVERIDRGGESYLTLYMRLPVDPFALRFVLVRTQP